MTAVTIITPAYNTAATLPRALESALAQTLQDIELLVVDDGSTDQTPQLAEDFAHRDPRVRVLHLPHGGASAARNRALAEAQGEYIAFLDSDDYLFPRGLAALHNLAQRSHAQICVGTAAVVPFDARPGYCSYGTEMVDLIRTRHSPLYFIHGFWTALYQRSFLAEHALGFAEDLISGSDVLFQAQAVTSCRRLTSCTMPMYCYVMRQGSLDAGAGRLGRDKVDCYLQELSRAFEVYLRAAARYRPEDVAYGLERFLYSLEVRTGRMARDPGDLERCRVRTRQLYGSVPPSLRAWVDIWITRRRQAHKQHLAMEAAVLKSGSQPS